MRATLLYEPGEVRVEDVPDAGLLDPTDALVSITRACICGSDLWPYKSIEPSETGHRMGHEAGGPRQGEPSRKQRHHQDQRGGTPGRAPKRAPRLLYLQPHVLRLRRG